MLSIARTTEQSAWPQTQILNADSENNTKKGEEVVLSLSGGFLPKGKDKSGNIYYSHIIKIFPSYIQN